LNVVVSLSLVFCLFSLTNVAVAELVSRAPAAEAQISKLKNLEPFTEVAVIQRRFLPKTNRFEASGGLATVMNDAFFLTGGLMANIAYNFTEFYGVELNYLTAQTSERQVTTDLRAHSVKPQDNFVVSKSYTGLAFKWAPIYGKIAFLEDKIIPYDLFFSVGYGQTFTNQDRTEGTIRLGFGQVFALSKDLAFRWDFAYHQFSAMIRNSSGRQSTSDTKNIFVYLGVSYFFPEAKYR
jgi:outer membrane beta-barrel protein